MKNIHLLPTDKPSKLGYHSDIVKEGKLDYAPLFGFDYFDRNRNYRHNPQHLYITSDETLKVGDWYIGNGLIGKNKFKWDKSQSKKYPNLKLDKIILTTDQDLIADGVQTIDDKFLEWFVQNPSCENVKVELEVGSLRWSHSKNTYKVVVPN